MRPQCAAGTRVAGLTEVPPRPGSLGLASVPLEAGVGSAGVGRRWIPGSERRESFAQVAWALLYTVARRSPADLGRL